jgi:type III pantothenate kinase
MIWAILIGNTRAVAGLMKEKKVVQRVIRPTASLRKAAQTLAWAKALKRISPVNGIVVASVVPPVDPAIRKALRGTFGIKPYFVNEKTGGIRLNVQKPSQVGADRIANAVAARALYGAPVIVVDYGTGTTFDVVDKKGDYVGGAILPGLGISLRALHDYTAKIPLISFGKPGLAVGRTTEAAVQSGVYYGAVGATREILSLIRKELGKVVPAVATGGLGGSFSDKQFFHRFEPNLTLIGMSILWRGKHAKH